MDQKSTLEVELPDQFEGLNAFAVGGVVRAQFTGNEASDVDLMVQGATVEEMNDRDFRLIDADSFPVFLDDLGREVALARTEQSNGPGHTDFAVRADPAVTVEEDLSRRDFTVNAMAVDLSTGQLIDPFDGRKDIEKGLIRAVSETTFEEDPLRILRMARFAARLDFSLETLTAERAMENVDSLEELPRERWGKEVKKAMAQMSRPRFIWALEIVGALEIVMPEVAALRDVPAGPVEYHAEGDALTHTTDVMREVNDRHPGDVRLMLAALAHDLGKGETSEDDHPSHPKHEKLGIDPAGTLAARLRLSNEIRGVMRSASRDHMLMHKLDELKESTLIRFVDRVDAQGSPPKRLTAEELIDLAEADSLGRTPRVGVDKAAMRSRIQDARDAIDAVTGADILNEFEPKDGEHVGELLLQERVKALKEIDREE